jgi:hypothetical protein
VVEVDEDILERCTLDADEVLGGNDDILQGDEGSVVRVVKLRGHLANLQPKCISGDEKE